MIAERAAVIAAARSWLKTPFHDGGCIKGAGVDCAMSVYAIYREAVPDLVPAIEVSAYSGQWHLKKGAEERYLATVLEHAREVQAPEPGDLALFRIAHAWAHGAIVLDWPKILHACSDVGQFCEARADQARLKGRAVRFFTVF